MTEVMTTGKQGDGAVHLELAVTYGTFLTTLIDPAKSKTFTVNRLIRNAGDRGWLGGG